MIRSMTGYGSAKGSSGKMEISIEIKSVNSRYLDCSVKLPRMYIVLEEPVKALVSKSISRGKVDVFISIDTSHSDDIDVKINRPLVEAYIKAFNEISAEFSVENNIGTAELSRFSDVLQIEKREAEPEQLTDDISRIVNEALNMFNEMRAKEGRKLSNDITERLDVIERLVLEIDKLSPLVVIDYTVKLKARIQEVLNSKDIDEQRILTEAAIFADRTAVSEEVVRLKSHISQLRDMLGSSEPVGRKIDFLVQEFNREANTIGSKGNDTEIIKLVVELKSEIEKIREQAQNIE